jgi:MFS family permease
MNINIGRWLLGGVVAGVILNVGEWLLNGVVLAKQMTDYMTQHNFPQPTGSAIGVAMAMTFVLGFVMILGYAAIRPRFGPGPKTAIIAALFTWFGVAVYPNVIGAAFGFIPTNVLLLVLGWALVEYTIAALVGAALYKEV